MAGGFLQGLAASTGSDADLIVVTMTSLVLFIVATYLLLRRGSAWHVAAGVTIGAVAVLYLLAVGDFITVESIWNGALWAQALRLVGLG